MDIFDRSHERKAVGKDIMNRVILSRRSPIGPSFWLLIVAAAMVAPIWLVRYFPPS